MVVGFDLEAAEPDCGQARSGRVGVNLGLAVRGVHDLGQPSQGGGAAWSLVHGLAMLWLNGNLPTRLRDDPEDLTRHVAPHLRSRRR